MTRKLRTVNGKADYARREAIVEPVFGQMKVAQRSLRWQQTACWPTGCR